MYSSYIVKRTQIYLDADQSAELARRAAVRGTTASKMIREAIDRYLADPMDDAERLRRFRAAVDESFGSVPRLPDGATYVADLRAADLARERQLRGDEPE
jgi:Arc/MetJ family transcription regulator